MSFGSNMEVVGCGNANQIDRFGWTNASYIHGLSLLSLHAKRALGVCAPYEVYAKAAKRE